ncbi:MAG: hypothetical protein Q8O42_04720 [Acidobacteriota bacterium]|nr:hypothetical protein [Acidobacteriota bacterium]
MSPRLRSLATAGLLAIVAFGLYAIRIGSATLSPAESELLHQATTAGIGADGYPLFFRVSDDRWLQPVAVYSTALMRLVASPETAGRLAAAAVGALNVALIFVLCRRLLASAPLAVGAALLLMFTPAHFVFARTGVDAIYPLPFVLAWLLAMAAYFDGGDRRHAAAGGLALGIGAFSHPSAPWTMGFLLVVTLLAIWRSGPRDAAKLAVPAVAFLAPLVVAAAWFAANPSAYPDTFGRWAIHAAHLRSPLDGVLAFVNWNTLGTRLSLYWGFFDPSWLFFDGPASPALPLRGTSPFLFATAVALVAGVSQRRRGGFTPVTLLLVAGVAVAPLAASTFGSPHAIADFLVLVPLVVLLAAYGVAGWLARADVWSQTLAWGVIAALVIDAARFVASA